jgi:glyoxylase-like metal-dependent hydrolase (beta-lactamase superfamily II)
MPNYICVTCGVQYAESDSPPAHCQICEDERQYIGEGGQQWTTLENLRGTHHNVFKKVEPNLTSVRTEPQVAIGQTAHVIQTPAGNVLCDCITYVDETTVAEINKLGSLAAIAVSHPHFYSTVVEWSRAFGGIPVYLHAADRQHMKRPEREIVFWEGQTREILPGVTAVNCGGHFEGSSVLHWADGASGKGVIFAADTAMVVADRRYVTFMYSYPNYIPMNATKVRGIVDALEPFAFDRIYSSFGRVVESDGKAVIRRSAERYIKAIS